MLAHRARTCKTAFVIGAGIGGAAAARALAERGMRVSLVDPCGIGQKSSGNAQGIVQPMLSGVGTLEGELARAAFWFASRHLAQLAPDLWHPTGTLWWREPKNLEVFRRRVKKLGWPQTLLREVTAAQASDLAGIPVPSDAIYCPAAGWTQPARLCARLADHPLITFEQRAMTQVRGDEADVVVIAAAQQALDLAASLGGSPKLRLTPVRGQTIGVPVVPASAPLKTVLHFGHYVVPAHQGSHAVGATHQSGDTDVACRSSDEAELLAGINANLPALAGAWDGAARTTRAGLRCHAPDRLPLVGFLPGHRRVALITALGPRGISLALLGAQVLAAQLFGEPLPVPSALAAAMDPARLAGLGALYGTAAAPPIIAPPCTLFKFRT